MIVKNPAILAEFRGPGRCEYCRQLCHREAHHLFRRGLGGGNRLDVRINLAGLCQTCHWMETAGHISRAAMLEIVAKREGIEPEELENRIYEMRRA